jgi:hypothetical protein
MPFTLAHPIAVIPIARWLRGRVVVSALVIGSMAPDLWNLFPSLATREEAHSLAGLFLHVLPLGLLCYVVFHLLLARPLVGLLPSALRGRLAPFLDVRTRMRSGPLACAVFSLILGALTHIVWDSVTHPGAHTVDALGILQRTWLRVGHVSFSGYRVLQIASTLGGMVGLALWIWRWWQSGLASSPDPDAASLDPVRVATLAGIAGIGFGFALHASLEDLDLRSPFLGGMEPLHSAAVGGLEGLLLGMVAFSVAWHLAAWIDRVRMLRGRAR